MTENNARKKAIRARMKATSEKYNVAKRRLATDRASRSEIGADAAASADWPQEPIPLDPGQGTQADKLRMLQQMRIFWNEISRGRRNQVMAELQVARARQAEVNAFWDRHKATVKERWAKRTGGRGETTVADIPEVAAQWHPGNPGRPDTVSASTQKRGTSPYLWRCPLGLGHPAWPAWPKDRIQAGTRCPACQQLIKLADIPTLAEQYRGPIPVKEITYASHDKVPWVCRTWAVEPLTGRWYKVDHHYEAVIKERALQGDGCRVCAGYVIDDTNSLVTWFEEISDQLDDPNIDPHKLPTSKHSASRSDLVEREGGDVYATLPWRCRHGHQWNATILNRVQGGNCPKCSRSGISKEQVRLVAELSGLMELVPPVPPDPRLSEGVPDFASHQIKIPLRFKPAHWRYKAVEVDAVFRLKHSGMRIGIEYDGSYHHSSKLRDRQAREIEKSDVLVQAGILDLVVHVRVGDLQPLEAPHALSVSVPEQSTPYEQACAVATALEARFPGAIPGLGDYLAGGRAQRQDHADAYILATWGELRPPRPKRERATPRPRRLKSTEPHRDSLLVPKGDPYRNPSRPDQIIRDYRCQCGRTTTAVQSQVTSGNTRSCGCLQDQAKRQPRPVISRTDTSAAREWARSLGIAIGSSGRVPDRVTASYWLHGAGHLQLLGPDLLLQEKLVREWAHATSRPLGARGRVPGELWIDYVRDYLKRQSPNE
ncbi:zinc-ribbon domain-containing protein [Microbispora sp. CA-102843]|uniref:zinc-ribbon domain-containing protein n=1 Tax=Microbispora sp. CA-102843 TaxID=3239952 RepID=UPI003D93DA27